MMRGNIFKHWQIIAATLFSFVLVFAAYVFASYAGPQVAQASTETALLKVIATKDSNGDGLPDWEKALYGIPVNATTTDYFHLGMTDGEAVAKGLIVPNADATIPAASSTDSSAQAGSLTDTFSKDFFSLYLAAKQANGGNDLSDDQTAALAAQALSDVPQTTTGASDAKTMSDIVISGTGPAALRTFAAAAEEVFSKDANTAATSEIDSLNSVVENNDTHALSDLAADAQIYQKYATDLVAIPVPKELASTDLALINTMLFRSQIDDDFTQVNTDPLTTILGLQQFSQTESDLWNEFSSIAAIYSSSGVVLSAGTPGASFVNFIANNPPVQQPDPSVQGGTTP